MKKITGVLATLLLVIAFACDDASKDDSIGDCEVVMNAQGPAFLKVINETGGTISAYLPEYALEAVIRPRTCEIYGVEEGNRDLVISSCADADCNDYTNEVEADFFAVDGETHTVDVTSGFFN